MSTPTESDDRSADRIQQDETIAAEPKLPPPDLPDDAVPRPLESHISKGPIAVAGVVENGVVRPLDPTTKLRENARVIIVARDGA